MDRCTSRPDITEITYKTAINTIRAINQRKLGEKKQRICMRIAREYRPRILSEYLVIK